MYRGALHSTSYLVEWTFFMVKKVSWFSRSGLNNKNKIHEIYTWHFNMWHTACSVLCTNTQGINGRRQVWLPKCQLWSMFWLNRCTTWLTERTVWQLPHFSPLWLHNDSWHCVVHTQTGALHLMQQSKRIVVVLRRLVHGSMFYLMHTRGELLTAKMKFAKYS